MNAPPRLSVVLPTHNRSGLLRRAIASLLAQTFDDFEILVVDDASTDATPEVVAELAGADPRVRYLRLDPNVGVGAARNRGLELARGELVALQDDDDVALPERFARQVAVFDADPATVLVASTVAWVDGAGQLLRVVPGKMRRGELPTAPAPLAAWLYLEGNWLPTVTLMLRRSSLSGVRFLEGVHAGEDWFLALQLMCRLSVPGAPPSRLVFLPEPLVNVLRGDDHGSLMAVKDRVFPAQRRMLREFRAWLESEGLHLLDALHGQAWAQQLAREARFRGGWRAVGLLARASLRAPRAAGVRAGWRWIGAQAWQKARRLARVG
jgi:glycosyltransferase involved in cell wall biosynthesis